LNFGVLVEMDLVLVLATDVMYMLEHKEDIIIQKPLMFNLDGHILFVLVACTHAVLLDALHVLDVLLLQMVVI
jgi:hypothetical protein